MTKDVRADVIAQLPDFEDPDNPLYYLRPEHSQQPRPRWMEGAFREAWERAQVIIQANKVAPDIAKYVADPIGFCHEVLGNSYTDEIKEVMLSVRDNPVTIVRSSNAVGKSYSAASLAVWFYKVFPDSQIYLTAAPPLGNLTKILWGAVTMMVERRPDLFTDTIKRKHTLIRSKNAMSFMTCVAVPTTGTSDQREAKFAGKHAPHLLFIVDEGDAVPEEVYKGIESCMTGGMARLLILFNPRARTGPIYVKERDNLGNTIHISAFNHPNVKEGRDVIPGAVTRQTVIRRINKWTRTLAKSEKPDAACFEVPSYLVGETAMSESGEWYLPLEPGWRKVEDAAFWYMVLGQYPAQSEFQLISKEYVERAQENYKKYVAEHGNVPPPGIKPILGLDIAEFGFDSSVACLRYIDYVAPFRFWKGLDPDKIAVEALEYYIQKDCEIAQVDGTGVGSSVAPSMVRQAFQKYGLSKNIRAVSVKFSHKPTLTVEYLEGKFYIIRDQMWFLAKEWLKNNKNAMLPPDPFLSEELTAPSYHKGDDGKLHVTPNTELRKMLHRSPDRATAFVLTFAPMARADVTPLSSQ